MHVIDSFSLFLSKRGLINCVTPPSKMLLLKIIRNFTPMV